MVHVFINIPMFHDICPNYLGHNCILNDINFRYSFRTLQIPICDPQIGPTTAKKSEEFTKLNVTLQNISNMAGLVVSLEDFITEYQAEYMHCINQRVTTITQSPIY